MRLKEDIVLVCIGEENYDPKIDGVHWINTGHLFSESEVAQWYSTADIFVYASIADNCPLAVLEAMACRLPVVTFKTGGIPELVRHMKTGYVAEYKNVEDLVKGLELFLNNKELRDVAGRRARTDVEEYFSLNRMVSSYIDLYYDVINKRATGRKKSTFST